MKFKLTRIKSVIEKFPFSKKCVLLLVGFWIILLLVFRFLLFPLNLDTPKWFPISEIVGIGLHKSGIGYLIAFVPLLIIILVFYKKINEFILTLGCGLLIALGNMMQGGFDFAFLQPFYAGNSQYYHDALNVPHVLEWLASFNSNQASLTTHSRTHPPFAVLSHDVFMVLFKNQLFALAIGFSLITVSTVLLLLIIMRLYGVDPQKRKLLVLLFSALPAINIYSIVSLDGVVLTTSSIFLLGLIVLITHPSSRVIGYLCLAIGLLATNMLSFGGIFLLGIGGIVALFEIVKKKRTGVFIGMIISTLILLSVIFMLKYVFNYDHFRAFLTASKLENPSGFRLFSDPIGYLLSRVENVSEIAFFLSFAVLAVFFNRGFLKIKSFTDIDKPQSLTVIGICILLLMFVTGAFRTGETARACLFIYPYLLLPFSSLLNNQITVLTLFSALQTCLMQLSINFHW